MNFCKYDYFLRLGYIYKLLQRVNSTTPESTLEIVLCGEKWRLIEYADLSSCPAFTCISYTWGADRISSPFDEDYKISARTISVIEAVINTLQQPSNWKNVRFGMSEEGKEAIVHEAMAAAQAIWIDALCVPYQDPARTECLKRMGEIYSTSWQVIAVLPHQCASIFNDIQATNAIQFSSMFDLDSDNWISRGWTYQEAVNSQVLFFVEESASYEIVSTEKMLNVVVNACDAYRAAHGIDVFAWAKLHPNLDTYQSLLSDLKNAQYAERPAYEVMAAMHLRTTEKPDDYFYAMAGAVNAVPLAIDPEIQISGSEYFMRVCDDKEEFSYLFNAAPRSDVLGKHWRPIEGRYSPVLPGLPTFGSGLSGLLSPSHIDFRDMQKLTLGSIDEAGFNAAKRFLRKPGNFGTPEELASAILDLIFDLGFSGCGEYIELTNGFYFPQSSFTPSEDTFVAISPDLQWTGGCPGMLLRSNSTAVNEFCGVGVFIGLFPKTEKGVISVN